VWLIGIVFLPYPTELIGVVGDDDIWAPVVYIGTLAVTSLAGLAMETVISRTPRIHARGMTRTHDLVPGLVTVGTMLVALVLALALPAIGMWSLLLLFAAPVVSRALSRGRRPAEL
jgi:uncharacterized membrane protein